MIHLEVPLITSLGTMTLMVINASTITVTIEPRAPIMVKNHPVDGNLFLARGHQGWDLGRSRFTSVYLHRRRGAETYSLTTAQETMIIQVVLRAVNEWARSHPDLLLEETRRDLVDKITMRHEAIATLRSKVSEKEEELAHLEAQLADLNK